MVHAHIDQRSSYDGKKKHSQTLTRDSIGAFQNAIIHGQSTDIKEKLTYNPVDLLVAGGAPSFKDARLNAYATASNFDKFYRETVPRDHHTINYNNNN